MRRRVVVLVAAAALAAAGGAAAASLAVSSASLTVATKTLTRQTCTLAPAQDTYVDSGQKNRSFGTSTSLLVAPGTAISYLQFNLAGCSFPAGATIDSATLRVVVTAVPASRTVSVYRATSSWTTSMTWSTGQPTFAATATATIPTGTTTGVKTSVVTADVDAWMTGAATNFGWRLADDGAGTGTTTLGSMENAANAPSLVVTYVH